MKILFDETEYCGAGTCVLVAPDVFDQREDDGIVVLLDTEPAGHLHAAAREAVSVCPASAARLWSETMSAWTGTCEHRLCRMSPGIEVRSPAGYL